MTPYTKEWMKTCELKLDQSSEHPFWWLIHFFDFENSFSPNQIMEGDVFNTLLFSLKQNLIIVHSVFEGVLGAVRKSKESRIFVFSCILVTKFLKVFWDHEVPPPSPCAPINLICRKFSKFRVFFYVFS